MNLNKISSATQPSSRLPALLAGLCVGSVWLAGFLVFLWIRSGHAASAPRLAEGRAHFHQSAHGGTVQVVGEHHVEMIQDTNGGVSIYILGRDETQMFPIAADALEAEVLPQNSQQVMPLILHAAPQRGERAGFLSRFSGKLPDTLRGQSVSVLVNVPLEGKLYRVRLDGGAHGADPGMPNNLADNDVKVERTLFLSPGGRYTQADIAANGNTIPSVKYAGFISSHNMHPQKGQRICPITNTLANPNLTWAVGGKTYTFCCPPCLREFVKQAKTKPDSIRAPEDYIQH
jgi:YHS domain-containing protein